MCSANASGGLADAPGAEQDEREDEHRECSGFGVDGVPNDLEAVVIAQEQQGGRAPKHQGVADDQPEGQGAGPGVGPSCGKAGVLVKAISGRRLRPVTRIWADRPWTRASAAMSSSGLTGVSPRKRMRPRTRSKRRPAKS